MSFKFIENNGFCWENSRIAQKINEGKISVWKTLGKNFVTIKMKKSKNFPKGYYLIDENHGIWNVDALKEHLKGQGFV